MKNLSISMSMLSQSAALCVVLAFIIGMRWQSGFYDELGFPWVTGYANYLDTMKAGVSITELFIGAVAAGFFSSWLLLGWSSNFAVFFVVLLFILLPMGNLVSPWFTDIRKSEFLVFRGYYQIIIIGLYLGGIIILLHIKKPNEQEDKIQESKNSIPTAMYIIMSVAIVMAAIFESPNHLGKAAAQIAISNGFSGYSSATDGKSGYWSIVGYSQGNLILAQPNYEKNQIILKLSNNISDWVIYPTAPIPAKLSIQ